jgi:hypothetical protein
MCVELREGAGQILLRTSDDMVLGFSLDHGVQTPSVSLRDSVGAREAKFDLRFLWRPGRAGSPGRRRVRPHGLVGHFCSLCMLEFLCALTPRASLRGSGRAASVPPEPSMHGTSHRPVCRESARSRRPRGVHAEEPNCTVC